MMRRITVATGAAGLLAISAIPVFAGQPARANIVEVAAYTDTATTPDPCKGFTAGDSVGRAQVNKQGGSGGGNRYHVQLKVKDVEPSKTYGVSLYTFGSDKGGPSEVCTKLDVTEQLTTDAEGDGTRNFKIKVDPGTWMMAVLGSDAAVVTDDLATSKFQLEGAKKKGKGKGKNS